MKQKKSLYIKNKHMARENIPVQKLFPLLKYSNVKIINTVKNKGKGLNKKKSNLAYKNIYYLHYLERAQLCLHFEK